MTLPGAAAESFECLVCGAGGLQAVPGFGELARITSDCRPFRPGGELFVCGRCDAVQKRPGPVWLGEIAEIYAAYASYYQSGGDEQIVFDRVSGQPRRRSDVLMQRIAESRVLPPSGAALDVGCGNGVTLSAMSSALPGWALHGFELGGGALARLQRIPGFRALHTGELSSVPGTFDLVAMIHSLEHFPDPAAVLGEVRRLASGGHLFLEVCNVEQNPFDVVVADHLMHFAPASLSRLLARAGFTAARVATDWVPKELSLLAAPSAGPVSGPAASGGGDMHARMGSYVRWLTDLVGLGRELAAAPRPMGIFGTSIAATWLASQLGGEVSFFVDEDESRVGRPHLGKPVYRPSQVPGGSVVYVALAPEIAGLIARRLAPLSLNMVMPPPLQGGTRA